MISKKIMRSMIIAAELMVATVFARPANAYINDRCQLADETSVACVIDGLSHPVLTGITGSMRIVNGKVEQKPGGEICEWTGRTIFFAQLQIEGTLPGGPGGDREDHVGGDAFAEGAQGEIATDMESGAYILSLHQQRPQNITLDQIPKLQVSFEQDQVQNIRFSAHGTVVTGILKCHPQPNKRVN